MHDIFHDPMGSADSELEASELRLESEELKQYLLMMDGSFAHRLKYSSYIGVQYIRKKFYYLTKTWESYGPYMRL